MLKYIFQFSHSLRLLPRSRTQFLLHHSKLLPLSTTTTLSTFHSSSKIQYAIPTDNKTPQEILQHAMQNDPTLRNAMTHLMNILINRKLVNPNHPTQQPNPFTVMKLLAT